MRTESIETFSLALALLKSGDLVRREAWPKGAFLELRWGESSFMSLPYIFMQQGPDRYPWTPDQRDLMAGDWGVVSRI